MDSKPEISSTNTPKPEDAGTPTTITAVIPPSTATKTGKEATSPGGSTSSSTAASNAEAAASPSSTDTTTASTTNDTTSTTAPVVAGPAPASTNDDTSRLPITTTTLRFTTVNDALSDGLMGREPLHIENDDIALVKTSAESQAWVQKLISAFGKNHLAEPKDRTNITPFQKTWFTRWQSQAHTSILAIYQTPTKGPVHLEKSCWHLFDAVIKAHELGVVTTSIITNGIPSKFKCSERLAYIVSVLEKYALVRLDVLRSWHVDEIAADPEGFIKRKITNCWNNGQRAEKSAEAKKAKEGEDGAKPGRKRKARGGDAHADQQVEQDAVETPAVRGKKAKVASSGSGGKSATNTDGEGKAGGKRGVKRTKSAAKLEDHDDSELASHESPISHAPPSVEGDKSAAKESRARIRPKAL